MAVEQTAPPAEDDRVQQLRRKLAAGTLSEGGASVPRAENLDIDPDHDPLAPERGGKLGRGFWHEDRSRDLP